MNDVTELVIIIDKSGSMDGLEKDVVGGFNSLIKSQKELGNTLVSLVFFNHEMEVVYLDKDINKVKELKDKDYCPNGCTALLDTIGNTISLIKEKHAKLDEKEIPNKTIFSIMTDGLENSSKEYTYQNIKKMINLAKKSGWEFIFQGANIDVEVEATRMGINVECAMSFEASPKGVECASVARDAMIRDIRKPKK